METRSVALLGIGTMGSGMGANLLSAGFTLAVWNRTASRTKALQSAGARTATSPAEAVEGASVIVAMLADDAASRTAWTGEGGALAAAEPGALLIEASTLSPAWVAELGALAKGRELDLLDAPVTGSRVQAEQGQLTFLVGGEDAALDRARPVLDAMSKAIVHLGPLGSGAVMKLVNNFLCGVQVAALAEGMAWIERSGLDRDRALSILKSGAPGSPLLSTISARMTSQDYGVNFLLKLMAKDLDYAHAAAAESGLDLTTARVAQALFETAIEAGLGEKDMASVIEPLRAKRN